MALTPEQKQALLKAKTEGLTQAQAYARVFRPSSSVTQSGQDQFNRLADIPSDIKETATGIGSSLKQRLSDIRSYVQKPTLRGTAAVGGNIPGAAFDIIGGLGLGAGKLITSPAEEQKAGEAIGKAVSATGIPQAIDKLSPEAQRDLRAGSGFLELGGLGLFSKAKQALTGSRLVRPKQTPEQVFAEAETSLKRLAADPNMSPRAQEEAAKAALNWKEKAIGLTPDIKSRLAEMGPEKLQEYLDAAHIRNIDDTAPTPYELGSQNVTSVLEKLDTQLRQSGSDIGQARQKLETVKAPVTSVNKIETSFKNELDKLNLTIKNGQIVQKPGTVSKTDAASDIRVLQSLYKDMQTFKQSPTLKNAIDLRMAFDGKIKFGKSARDVSNSVDPVSRSVRKAIADEAAKVVGKSNAAELKRYGDFMEAYGDLKSYTDRAAGGEYLLRLVLSGRGGEARKLIETVKEYTGIDLMNDATAMKVSTEILGNENTKNLFRQEVTRAGYDAAAVLSGSPTGIAQVALQRLMDYGIDQEDILKAAAVGAGGYVLATYTDQDGFLLPAGLVVLSAMPQAQRMEAIQQARSLGKKVTVPDDIKDQIGKALDNYDAGAIKVKDNGVDMLEMGDDVDADLSLLKDKLGSGKLTNDEYIEAYDSLIRKGIDPVDDLGKAPSATTKTTDLLEEARKYDSAEEFVDSQSPLYHTTSPEAADSILKNGFKVSTADDSLMGEGVYLANSAAGTKLAARGGNGAVIEVRLKPGKKLLNNSSKEYREIVDPIVPDSYFTPTRRQKVNEEIKKRGYSGIKTPGETVVFNPSDLDIVPRQYKTSFGTLENLPEPTIVSVSKLKPSFEEWTKLSPKIKEIEKSVGAEGIKQPLVVNKATMEILDGNKRYQAIKNKGIVEAPVVYVNDGIHSLVDLKKIIEGLDNQYSIKTRTQLEDIWKQANYPSATTKTTDLLEEARKYDSAADFSDAIAEQRGGLKLAERTELRNIWKEANPEKIKAKEERLADIRKRKEERVVSSNVPDDTTMREYGMSHRPSQTGATADDISKGGEVIPEDFYQHPEWYADMSDKAYQESWQALQKIKGKPNAEITVYRASPKNELNEGDWITLSKEYAKRESLDEGVEVHSFKTKAKDVQFAGDDINEFGYWPIE